MAEQAYLIGKARVGLRTTSAPFFEWVDDTLAAYRDPGPIDEFHVSIVIDGAGESGPSGRRGFHIIYKGTTAVIRTLHLPTIGRALLTDLEWLLFGERHDAVYADAAVLALGEVTALVPIPVVPFLGRLGRRVERKGVRLPVAVGVAVDPATGHVVPVRPILEIPRDAIIRLGAIGDPTGKTDKLIVDRPVAADAVFMFVDEHDTLVRPVSKGLALHQLANSVRNFRQLGGTALEGLGRLVAGAQCYGLGTAEPGDMLDVISATLASPGIE